MTAATMREAFERAEPHNVWPLPDLTLIDNGRRPAVPMPHEMFGPAWSIIEDVADTTATAPDYAAIAYLTAAASVIGGKRWVNLYGDWKEPCILWMVALGEPSSRKSAPLDKMTRPLWEIEKDARDDHEDALRGWQADVERAKAERSKWQDDVKAAAGTPGETPALPALAVEPERPPERHTIISDVTPEAAAAVLAGNPQGVLCYNDELQQFFDSFERYTSGGRSFWLTAHGGRPHSVTRKGAGSIFVKFNGISVLGSIQPDRIAPLLAGANDGLIPRFLFAWPEKMPPRIPSRRFNSEALESAYRRLDSLPWGMDENGGQCAIVLPLAADAVRTFHAWEIANDADAGVGGGLYQTFAGKLSGAAARLALVAEYTRWAFEGGAEPAQVSNVSVAAAIAWIEEYAKPMAARAFGDAAVSTADRNASLLARYIVRYRLDLLNMRELRLHPHKGHLKPLQAKGAMEEAFTVLEDAGWIAPAFSREGDTAGQPRKDFRVNPAVHGRAK